MITMSSKNHLDISYTSMCSDSHKPYTKNKSFDVVDYNLAVRFLKVLGKIKKEMKNQ